MLNFFIMNIQILAQKFYDHSLFIRGYSKYTIQRYKTVIQLYCKYAEVSDIEEVNENTVRNFFFYGRTKHNWKARSFITFHMSLSVFFQWCIKEGYMKNNPTEDVELPKVDKRLPSRLTKQDSLKLLEVVYNYPYEHKFLRYRNHAMFSMFIFAGLRKNELLKLRYTDVDIENLNIRVNLGKGSKDRIIPMTYTLAESLKKYLEERKRLGKTCAYFFCSLHKNSGYTDSGLKRLVVQLRQASGVSFTIHRLRHTYATLMIESGCDIYSLSKMLGHSDIKTTTIYLSASVEHLRLQMAKHPLNNL